MSFRGGCGVITDFAWKLRLTAGLLGCATRKDLAAAFRAANPRTSFDIERAHKWLQGRSLPRDSALYADWAKVLGTARPPAWLVSSAREAFLEELCVLADAEPAALLERAEAFGGAPKEAAPHFLCGRFVAYSHAWARARRGQLIRGALRLGGGRGGCFELGYAEVTGEGELAWSGRAHLVGRVLHATLEDAASGTPLFLSVLVPGRPAAALCGVLAGATSVSADPEPSATRIALLRLAPGAAAGPRPGPGYLRPDELPDDLAALGFPRRLAAPLRACLHGDLMQVPPASLAAIGAALDASAERELTMSEA